VGEQTLLTALEYGLHVDPVDWAALIIVAHAHGLASLPCLLLCHRPACSAWSLAPITHCWLPSSIVTRASTTPVLRPGEEHRHVHHVPVAAHPLEVVERRLEALPRLHRVDDEHGVEPVGELRLRLLGALVADQEEVAPAADNDLLLEAASLRGLLTRAGACEEVVDEGGLPAAERADDSLNFEGLNFGFFLTDSKHPPTPTNQLQLLRVPAESPLVGVDERVLYVHHLLPELLLQREVLHTVDEICKREQ
jgi:hypothetical protein